jgi:hypothetical protein
MNPLFALASFSAPSFDVAPGPDELAATVAVLDFLDNGSVGSRITVSWDARGYRAAGARGPARTARCMATDDPRYDEVLVQLGADQARAVAGTIRYEESEGEDGAGSARFQVSAAPASPASTTTPLCIVFEGTDPVAVTAVRFESTGENRANYTATVFAIGPRA